MCFLASSFLDWSAWLNLRDQQKHGAHVVVPNGFPAIGVQKHTQNSPNVGFLLVHIRHVRSHVSRHLFGVHRRSVRTLGSSGGVTSPPCLFGGVLRHQCKAGPRDPSHPSVQWLGRGTWTVPLGASSLPPVFGGFETERSL